jgi:putative redox protein
MNETVITNWVGGMAFESRIDDFTVTMDTDPQYGGTHFGPRPKPLVLSSLAGCTGMDMVSILMKKRVVIKAFRISINAEVLETHPKYYNKIHLIFEVTGEGFEGNQDIYEKVQRAAELSRDSYCGVNAMLRHAAEITHEIRLVNG